MVELSFTQNEELVKIVRHLLEYNEREISIDRALGELLKHDNGTLMQAMIYKSGLVSKIHISCVLINSVIGLHRVSILLRSVQSCTTKTSINRQKSKLSS